MYSFGEFTLDPLRFELRRSGTDVHVEPQVFDVLRYLIEHRDRVVTKAELLDEVWGSRFVSDTTLTTRIKAARRALADDGEAQRWIRTVRGRGYQFVGDTITPGASAGVVVESGPPVPEDIRFCHGDDGVRIAYGLAGAGPPLVKAANWMTHLGYDSSSLVWQHWLAALSERHRLVRYDERGCGLSQWGIPSFSFENWVRDLETVVDAAGLGSFPLLGLSQGAAVAIAYAVAHPERVERLVLVGGYAAGRAVRARSAQEQAASALDIELARVGWGGADRAFRGVFAMQFYPDGPPEIWDAFDELQRRTTPPDNAVRFLQEFARVDVRDLAPQVRCPVLLLHSRDDMRVPYERAGRVLAELIPHSKLVPLPSRNHLLTGEEPAWPMLLDELWSFLA